LTSKGKARPGRFLVPRRKLSWRCPRGWTSKPEHVPERPARLWCQPRVLADLQGAAAAFSKGVARHVEVSVPATPGWTPVVADALSGAGPIVHPLTRAGEDVLRGKGFPGALARADYGIVVMSVHDAHPPKATEALAEAVEAGSVLPLPKKKGEDDVDPAPAPARILLVVVGTDAALKKWRDDRPRVAAWFHRRIQVGSDTPATREHARLISERLRRFAAAADLGRPRVSALERLIEDAHAVARRGRLLDDTTFAEDVLLEAGPKADRDAVEAAIARIKHRRGGREQAHRERLANGRLRVRADGREIGVANGLMVYSSGRSAYALPGRISARVAVGREGVINVEREAKYSGRSFDKGVFLLSGFLRATFAHTAPLAVAASLAFEQSYGRIDGDSATVAETAAILSALSGVPCRQDVAVTGAMTQRGELLPVGSLSLKIEGWWRTCRDLGAGDAAGVLIPVANLPDLHLSADLVAEIEAGRFAVWAVSTIEEAIEVLLDRPAGELREGKYRRPSVYGRAAMTLNRMSARLYPPRPSRKAAAKAPAKAAAKAEETS